MWVFELNESVTVVVSFATLIKRNGKLRHHETCTHMKLVAWNTVFFAIDRNNVSTKRGRREEAKTAFHRNLCVWLSRHKSFSRRFPWSFGTLFSLEGIFHSNCNRSRVSIKLMVYKPIYLLLNLSSTGGVWKIWNGKNRYKLIVSRFFNLFDLVLREKSIQHCFS